MSSLMLVTADKELARVVKLALRDTPVKITMEISDPNLVADAIAQHPSTLVLLDLFLPQSSGLDMLKRGKQVNENGLFVLLTRIRTRNLIERAFRLGAQDVIHYPVSGEVLRDTILHRLQTQPLDEPEEKAPEPSVKPARKQ